MANPISIILNIDGNPRVVSYRGSFFFSFLYWCLTDVWIFFILIFNRCMNLFLYWCLIDVWIFFILMFNRCLLYYRLLINIYMINVINCIMQCIKFILIIIILQIWWEKVHEKIQRKKNNVYWGFFKSKQLWIPFVFASCCSPQIQIQATNK